MSKENSCCCCSGQSEDETNMSLCPACNSSGRTVSKITVQHLVNENSRKDIVGENYYICMDEDCDMVYFNNEEGVSILTDNVSVPIWFKKDADPKYACYCGKVTVDQIIDGVLNKGVNTVKDANEILGTMKNANCKINNPLGSCCHNVIQAAIEEGIRIRKESNM